MIDYASEDFEKEYFEKYYYDEENNIFLTYSKSWERSSFIPHFIKEFSALEKNISTALVLGSATGESLHHLQINNIKAYGIELSKYAQQNVRSEVKDNVKWGSITDILPDYHQRGHFYDVIYSSSLQFLTLAEIETLLPMIRQGSHYFSHFGGYKNFGENPYDLKIKTLENFSWWKELFADHNFKPTHSPYIWHS